MFRNEALKRRQLCCCTRNAPCHSGFRLKSLCLSRVVKPLSKAGIYVMSHAKDSFNSVGLQIPVNFNRLPVKPNISGFLLRYYAACQQYIHNE